MHEASPSPENSSTENIAPLNDALLNRLDLIKRDIRSQVGFRQGITEHELIDGKAIGWCTCPNAPLALRLDLIDHIVEQVARCIPDDGSLEVTSIGSGRLLQEYLLVERLMALSPKQLKINLVDPFYDCAVCGKYNSETGFIIESNCLVDAAVERPPFCLTELVRVEGSVLQGFTHSLQDYLSFIRQLSEKHATDFEVEVLNSERCFVDGADSKNHFVMLVDPGEPALSNREYCHFVGVGSSEALPHQEPLLCFFDSEELDTGGVTEDRVLVPKRGRIYLKSNLYDEVDLKDRRLVTEIQSMDRPSKRDILSKLATRFPHLHHYEDATESFLRTARRYPAASTVLLAQGEIQFDEALKEHIHDPVDERLKRGDSILGRKLNTGYRLFEFDYY